MLKRILWLGLALVLLLMFTACGSSDDICPVCEAKVDFANQAFCPNCGHPFGSVKAEGYTDSDGEVYEAEKIETGSDSGEITGAYTLEQAAEKGGIYVKKDSMFYSIDEQRLYVHENFGHQNYGVSFSGLDNVIIMNISDGDLLVTFDSKESYDIYPITCSFYCYPFCVYEVTEDGISFEKSHNPLTKIEEEQSEYECYNLKYGDGGRWQSRASSELEEFLLWSNCFLFRNYICTFRRTPINLTVPYYSGTQYMEYDLPVSAEMYYIPDQMSVPVERTKNGYFIIDTSQLASGKYALACREQATNITGIYDSAYFSVFEIFGQEETNSSSLLGSWSGSWSDSVDFNYTFYDDERLEITIYDYLDDYDEIVDDDYTYSEREYYDENGQLQVGIVGECKRTYLYKDYGLGIEIYDSMDNEGGGFYDYRSGWYELDSTGTKLTLNEDYYTYELERVD